MSKISWLLAPLAAAILFTLTATRAQAQVTLADWTFETSQPSVTGSNAGPYAPELGTEIATAQASGFHSVSASVFSTPSGNGSSHSFSSNNWSPNDYYQFTVSTLGFATVDLQWDQIGSATGPGKFLLEYSTDGTNFTPIGSDYSILSAPAWNGTFSSTTHFDPLTGTGATLVSGLGNVANLTIRLMDDSAVAINGGTVGSGGTGRVDNFTVQASKSALYWNGATTGVGVTFSTPNPGSSDVWDTGTADWNVNADGHGTLTTYGTKDALNVATFAGTAGTVNIASTVTAASGMEFDVGGYTISGGTLAVGADSNSNTINVNTATGQTATISAKLIDPSSGTFGINKTGNGTLVLANASNGFHGPVTVTGTNSVLSISADGDLGDSGNGIVLNGGTLASSVANLQLGATRTLSGTGGIDVPASSTVTLNGPTAASNAGGLTLTDTGTLVLANPNSGNQAFGSLVFTGVPQGSATNAGTISALSDGSGTLTFNGISTAISANNPANTTATINGNVTFASLTATRPIRILNANATLAITGSLSGKPEVEGLGILDAQGNNSGIANMILGVEGFSDHATFVVHDKNSMGTGTVSMGGGVVGVKTDLTGANALGVGLNISALGSLTSAEFGSATDSTMNHNIEFTGQVNLARSSSTATSPRVTVYNTTTFSGPWVATTTPTGVTGSTQTTFVVAGTGTLVIDGPSNALDLNMNLSQKAVGESAPTVDVQVAMPGVPSLGIFDSGTVNISGSGSIGTGTTKVTLGSTTDNPKTGNTLAIGGTSQTFDTLVFGSPSTIDLGGAGAGTNTLTFSGPGTWTAASTDILTIKNWNYNATPALGNRVVFTSSGLSTAQLAQIQFADFHQGAQFAPATSPFALGEIVPTMGDITQDGILDVTDVTSLLKALANRDSYAALHPSFTPSDINFILDVNGDGKVNNADIQSLLTILQNAASSTSAVPEPSTLLLGLLGSVGAVAVTAKRRRKIA